MNTVSRFTLVGATLAILLAGCQKSDVSAVTSNRVPTQTTANAGPIPQMPTGDPSVPDASTVAAEQTAGDKTTATQETAALQQKPPPQEKMTTAEESKAMPLPAQANDHSTTALDKGKGG
ncbi:MAG: hypothetical protein ABI886_16880 [Betaproteobacteria bacterium]